MSTLQLKVKGLPGSTPEQCAQDILDLSKKLDLCVYLNFNGKQMFSWPTDTVDQILERFNRNR